MFHSRRLIACLVALLLVLAQQAAFAHLIGHAGGTAQTLAQSGEDAGHDAALTLSHQCTTCLAFAALASPGPSISSLPAPKAEFAADIYSTAPAIAARQSITLAYLSRAPPV